jgi:hypothetical protein
MDRLILDDLRMAERHVVKLLGNSKSKEDVMPIGMRPTSHDGALELLARFEEMRGHTHRAALASLPPSAPGPTISPLRNADGSK